eukprot:CAMPEP_0174977444 /NCGR_PEP_ID=MMETSP0004_2-20121128/13606_1 /TAXON_ID=420556 /ORGANISM="Ochromonas sp., Strain CCMP1393" /LENGTH=323 /DNA_ID=CAMNT_0016228615 /DNA_START=572 /DNA_END=1543 /DNA_ORIENTATION=+
MDDGEQPSTEECGKKLEVGNIIMGNPLVMSMDRHVKVLRKGAEVESGSSYVAGEELTVKLENGEEAGLQFVLETSPNAMFLDGGCGGIRAADAKLGAILLLPESGDSTEDIEIVAGWANGYGSVYLSPKFTLSVLTANPGSSYNHEQNTTSSNRAKVGADPGGSLDQLDMGSVMDSMQDLANAVGALKGNTDGAKYRELRMKQLRKQRGVREDKHGNIIKQETVSKQNLSPEEKKQKRDASLGPVENRTVKRRREAIMSKNGPGAVNPDKSRRVHTLFQIAGFGLLFVVVAILLVAAFSYLYRRRKTISNTAIRLTRHKTNRD